ncbi:DUF421 domain-containing protein [Paenibacillus mucilaginosus]|uniref:YetF C-terminal domain-containing protein n=3 Tax=Paenibacillus mucilaginosus TaxID=61624 RepID=H6NQE9_9BACL|nr:DUF421 domain-containing protein [Paenibacillus mucilaginosus]AEI44931.1 hypothetical protein KNP414_06410 [Paenibacillus mucilaginosus KNP414]AFC32673.1 hypothetical protein PM3016_6022 [Paenibacillus mucilaginosus 3016]AFH65004.1 membrane protein [Paenibacillus mucilaginosus K02]MCG7214971.1 DUF421 domain-containing protein [Paenibacillus mucilaginosus]WDM26444.1 DUF421 domain-containing protein [Paenibacillus mucilaginosus]
MEMLLVLFFRTLLVYVVVFLTMRLMGKREIGKLSLFDLVISIMIAEIAVFVLEDLDKPLIQGILPMLTLVLVQVFIALVSLKSQKLRRLFEGQPSPLIEHGHLNREEMRKQRYNLDDLLLQLRENKVLNVADVEFAVLEPSGKLTVQQKTDKEEEPPCPPPSFRYEGLPLPLIMDGKVQDDSLKKLDQTRFWLKRELQSRGIKDFKEVFFCSLDHRGRWFIDKKR